MVAVFPEDEWMEEWRDLMENDEDYAKYSEGWGDGFDGSFIYAIEADEEMPETRYFYFEFEGDQIHSMKEVDDPNDVEHGYVYSGAYSDWVKLTSGELDPVNAMMGGIFSLEGEMQKALAYNSMATRMFTLTTQIDTEYKY